MVRGSQGHTQIRGVRQRSSGTGTQNHIRSGDLGKGGSLVGGQARVASARHRAASRGLDILSLLSATGLPRSGLSHVNRSGDLRYFPPTNHSTSFCLIGGRGGERGREGNERWLLHVSWCQQIKLRCQGP